MQDQPASLRLEFSGKISENSLPYQKDAKDKTSGELNREEIADLLLLRKRFSTYQYFQERVSLTDSRAYLK